MNKPTLPLSPAHFDQLKTEVIDAGICVRCGICTGACPVSCIIMDRKNPLPHLVEDIDCTSCGICLAACPEKGVDYAGLSHWLFDKTPDPWDLGGTALKGFVGHLVDEAIWDTTSGGGLITGLLIHLLESGQYDGALVVGFDDREPWRAKPRIVRTRKEILTSTRSKHTLVSIADLLREIRDDHGRYVMVGAGCHVTGLRKLQQVEVEWQAKVPLVLGIACGGSWYPEGTEYLLREMGVHDPSEVVELAYRAKDGTGANALLKNGERKSTGRFFGHDVYRMNLLYHAEGCTVCPDLLSILADLTVGDTGPGKISFAFLRTQAAMEAMKGAVRAGIITGEWHTDVDYKKGMRKDHPMRVKLKYREAYSTIAKRKSQRRPFPDYGSFAIDPKPLWTHPWDRWIWEGIYTLVHNLWGRRFLNLLPSNWVYTLGKLRGAWELQDYGFWSGLRGQRFPGFILGSIRWLSQGGISRLVKR